MVDHYQFLTSVPASTKLYRMDGSYTIMNYNVLVCYNTLYYVYWIARPSGGPSGGPQG